MLVSVPKGSLTTYNLGPDFIGMGPSEGRAGRRNVTMSPFAQLASAFFSLFAPFAFLTELLNGESAQTEEPQESDGGAGLDPNG